MYINQLDTFPIKSAKGFSSPSVEVLPTGLKHDRQWALFDHNNQVITAREFPELLNLKTTITNEDIEIYFNGHATKIPSILPSTRGHDLLVFKEPARGFETDPNLSELFSDLLGTKCRLMMSPNNLHRPVLRKYGGKEGDHHHFADECPILLTNEASLDQLNAKLPNSIDMRCFRPNIVIKGADAFEEDTWKRIRIGDCEFDVVQKCKRCVMVTIDPDSGKKDPEQEPLRTLATFRKHPRGGVAFGMHLIPRKTGLLRTGDQIEVLEAL